MKSYDELLAERDALSAKIATPKDAKTIGALVVAIDAAPSQCLAEIKAEAVKDFVMFLPSYAYNINDELEKEANKYAAKIRNTGTWLKDSNVNGGKRGGDK